MNSLSAEYIEGAIILISAVAILTLVWFLITKNNKKTIKEYNIKHKTNFKTYYEFRNHLEKLRLQKEEREQPKTEGRAFSEASMVFYFIEGLKKFAVFEGRASRAEFWNFYCLMLILVFLSIKLDVHLFDVPEGWGPAYIVTSITLFIPTLSIGARRLHDVGKSGWWQLISLTGIGVILLIAWWASKPISGSYSKKIKTEKTSSKSKLAEELRELKELYKDGTLSKKEFTKAKNKLLQ